MRRSSSPKRTASRSRRCTDGCGKHAGAGSLRPVDEERLVDDGEHHKGTDRVAARWRTPEGASRSQTFGRRVDAERYLTNVEHSKLSGGYVDPASGKVTFADYAERWRAAQVHRETTAATIGGHLRVHFLPTFGPPPIGSVRPSEVQVWVRGRADAVAPSTVEQCYRTLAAVFHAAVADRLIASSPCVGIKLSKRERRRVVPLETAEVMALIDAVPDASSGRSSSRPRAPDGWP
jgi:hypothetical protein